MTQQNDELLAARAIENGAYEEAIRLLMPLAERKSEYALLTLGWIHETGANGSPNKPAARSFYELAASGGSDAAYLYLGWLLLKEGRDIEAGEAFERGAQLNNVECKSVLARLADNAGEKLAGKAIEDESYEEAVRLLRPLAERNSEYALRTLGWVYETGAIAAPDKDAARAFYTRAAGQGSAAACFDLGRLLLKEGEESRARSSFEAGAQRDHIPSMAELGRMMVEGSGGPVDVARGHAWLEKAAAQGHIFAQRTLLAIQEKNAQSLSEKFSIKKRIAALTAKGGREMLKDPHSDKLR
jgi:TPR repeat protein